MTHKLERPWPEWRYRVSVALTGLGCLGLAAAAFAGVGALNAPFISFLHRKRGPLFAAACFPLHLLHYLCGGIGFGYAWGELKLGPLARHPVGAR